MSESGNWSFPVNLQPRQEEVGFDLGRVLDAVVGLRAEVPEDAFTASMLGTERVGNGVVIRDDGLVLTIGYLVTEATNVWLTANDGSAVQGYPLAYDQASGFGLVMPLGELHAPAIARGTVDAVGPDAPVFVVGHGGRGHALKAKVVDKREFAGYWEYVLEQAVFTAPAHPLWSGAALVGPDGRLLGIGSLLVQEQVDGEQAQGNMFVPVDLLAPILEDMTRLGRPAGPPRPWLGMYLAEDDKGRLVVTGLATQGPADRAGVRLNDVVRDVAGARVEGLAGCFRAVWRCGPAGATVPLTLVRNGTAVRVDVVSADRGDFLRKPQLH
jgi:S1-C subfamily serine protease